MVEYKYDAWVKPIGDVIGTLAELNPFRYRGDVWDEETGLYYLRERFIVQHYTDSFPSTEK